jgi:hypothetical protein
MNTRFDVAIIEGCLTIPVCRAREVLSLLIEVDPISAKESEQYRADRSGVAPGTHILTESERLDTNMRRRWSLFRGNLEIHERSLQDFRLPLRNCE